MTVGELRPGAIFETVRDGVRAVKSEYRLSGGQCECVLLESGELAHFPDGDAEAVRELPGPPPAWTKTPPTAPGWYWIRAARFPAMLAEVYFNGPLLCVAGWRLSEPKRTIMGAVAEMARDGVEAEWRGPLEAPA